MQAVMYVLTPPAIVHRATDDHHGRHHSMCCLARTSVCEVVIIELPSLYQPTSIGRYCTDKDNDSYNAEYIALFVITVYTSRNNQFSFSTSAVSIASECAAVRGISQGGRRTSEPMEIGPRIPPSSSMPSATAI